MGMQMPIVKLLYVTNGQKQLPLTWVLISQQRAGNENYSHWHKSPPAINTTVIETQNGMRREEE